MTVGTLTVEILAQEPTGPEFGKASPLGLALVVLLLVATALLVWNMNKRLKKLPATFEPEKPEPDQALDDGTIPGAAPDSSPSGTAPKDAPTVRDPERPEPTGSN